MTRPRALVRRAFEGVAKSRLRERRQEPERGNMLVLGLGLWLVAAMLVLVVAVASDLHAERRDLLAEADSVVLALADDVADAAYFRSADLEKGELGPVSEAELVLRAKKALRPNTELAALVVENDATVRLRLSRRVSLEAARILAPSGSVLLEAESAARLRPR